MKLFAYAAFAGAFALASVTAKEVGKAAPDFSVQDVTGKTVSLADQKGKVVVLEWVNFGCPFVKKHYDSGNIQKLQETYTGKEVVWLSVSSAGKDNFVEGSKLAELAKDKGSKATDILVDQDGKVGKAYDAKVTPHLYIINKEGVLVYNGAIDSIATTEASDIPKADKLFANALDNVLAGKPVENAKNQPYGCGVKY
ncbi:MAG: redoxin domain-containing protein [Verrucomicrobiaceae bacterium]|nr:MAG: redoxin domain-containing protein [Verrucomicrobiaceae bacterium]